MEDIIGYAVAFGAIYMAYRYFTGGGNNTITMIHILWLTTYSQGRHHLAHLLQPLHLGSLPNE